MFGTVLRQKGLLAEAKRALEAAIRLKPEDPGPYSQMAQVLRLQGDEAGSSKYLVEAAAKKAVKEAMQKEMFDRASGMRPKVIR
jgi:Flp pilus assembly protein TadD